MIPLADMHCHLLAGLDDGPRSEADALEMCRLAHDEGTRLITALAHQNEHYPQNTPDCIRQAARKLADKLQEIGLGLSAFPCAEVMLEPDFLARWSRGEYLTVADRGQYLLLEMPHDLFIDLRPIVAELRRSGVRPILAHPERCPELLDGDGRIEQLIQDGCLVQVSSGNVTKPPSSKVRDTVRDWFRRGIAHVLGSDGHSPRRRPPRMADAYQQIARWAGTGMADRVCSTNGTAIAHGIPLNIPAPLPRARRWFSRIW